MGTSCCNANRAFHTRLCRRGKPRKVTLAAMYKLLLILNAVTRDQASGHRLPLPTALNA